MTKPVQSNTEKLNQGTPSEKPKWAGGQLADQELDKVSGGTGKGFITFTMSNTQITSTSGSSAPPQK
jgi:hypothetical protein